MKSNIGAKTAEQRKRWNLQQDIAYNLFLVLQMNCFRPSTKAKRIAEEMSYFFFQVKNQGQCKSHHQKKLGSNDIDQYLYRFYVDNYSVRHCDWRHSQKQFKIYLQKKGTKYLQYKRSTIEELMSQFDSNLKIIMQFKRRKQQQQKALQKQYSQDFNYKYQTDRNMALSELYEMQQDESYLQSVQQTQRQVSEKSENLAYSINKLQYENQIKYSQSRYSEIQKVVQNQGRQKQSKLQKKYLKILDKKGSAIQPLNIKSRQLPSLFGIQQCPQQNHIFVEQQEASPLLGFSCEDHHTPASEHTIRTDKSKEIPPS